MLATQMQKTLVAAPNPTTPMTAPGKTSQNYSKIGCENKRNHFVKWIQLCSGTVIPFTFGLHYSNRNNVP